MTIAIDENIEKNDSEVILYTHKYAVHFDILPEISYLDQTIPIIIADLLPLFNAYPKGVWISQQSVDEGLDFCRVIFWVFSKSTDKLKNFTNWFQAIFREEKISKILERMIVCALDQHNSLDVELADWTRVNVHNSDIQEAIKIEKTIRNFS